jgi:hypothetical protein
METTILKKQQTLKEIADKNMRTAICRIVENL